MEVTRSADDSKMPWIVWPAEADGIADLAIVGDRVIAISHTVHDYIRANYPQIDPSRITVIHRGVDTHHFSRCRVPDQQWSERFFSEYPRAAGKPLLLMPGHLSRWKGQIEFIELVPATAQESIPQPEFGSLGNDKREYLLRE